MVGAFSQIARAQMRDPLGSSTGGMLTELQALEDLLGAAAPAAIQDATGVGAILDVGGDVNAMQPTRPTGATTTKCRSLRTLSV